MRTPRWAPVAIAALGLAACQDIGGTDTTRVTLQLTDAPGDVLEAVVTISQIYLQGGSDSTNASGRVVLKSSPVTTDLLKLANDVETLVDSAAVPSGTYSQLRFVLSGAYLKVDAAGGPLVYATAGYAGAPPKVDGTLQCPSCSQSGLKVTFPGGITLDGTAQTWVVDFDVSESFGQEAGQSGKWVMRPSLKATKS